MANQSTAPQPKPDDEPQKSVVIPESKEEFAGPIPPPSMMKQYEETLPGSADRILKMAENQSEHRQWMEKKNYLLPIVKYISVKCSVFLLVLSL